MKTGELIFGDDGADGSLESGGANIVIPGDGVYHVILDLNTSSYSLDEVIAESDKEGCFTLMDKI